MDERTIHDVIAENEALRAHNKLAVAKAAQSDLERAHAEAKAELLEAEVKRLLERYRLLGGP